MTMTKAKPPARCRQRVLEEMVRISLPGLPGQGEWRPTSD